MTKSSNESIEMMMALEILDHAELETIEGGYVWGPSCPGYPGGDGGDGGFVPFGPGPTFPGPIVLCGS